MSADMRKVISMLVLLLLQVAPAFGAAAGSLGAARCERDAATEPCRIAWDFTATPRAFYWVDRFDFNTDSKVWTAMNGPLQGHVGATDYRAEGGFLYRVVGCNDKARTLECVESTVFWAPKIPKNVDDIPDVIHSPKGYYLRDPTLPDYWQILEYNMALIARLVDTVDMSAMPPMTALPFEDLRKLPPGIGVTDATIDYNVHLIYPVH
jgi:hypothetical protein